MSDQVWVRAWDESQLHPIDGIAGSWNRFVHPSPENGGLIAGLGRLEPGEAMGYHQHSDSEVFYVLRGRGEAHWRVADQEHTAELKPGVAFYKVGGIPHQMINTGDEPLVGFVAKVDVRQR